MNKTFCKPKLIYMHVYTSRFYLIRMVLQIDKLVM